jgi:hypothetical protein
MGGGVRSARKGVSFPGGVCGKGPGLRAHVLCVPVWCGVCRVGVPQWEGSVCVSRGREARGRLQACWSSLKERKKFVGGLQDRGFQAGNAF